MNFFLSEFRCHQSINRSESYDAAIGWILDFAQTNSLNCFRSREFLGYDSLEQEISDSSFLVAVIDEFWTSSTWKSHEFMFASGWASYDNKNKCGPIIPKISALVLGTKEPIFIQSAPMTIYSGIDIDSLSKNILQLYNMLK